MIKKNFNIDIENNKIMTIENIKKGVSTIMDIQYPFIRNDVIKFFIDEYKEGIINDNAKKSLIIYHIYKIQTFKISINDIDECLHNDIFEMINNLSNKKFNHSDIDELSRFIMDKEKVKIYFDKIIIEN